MYVPNELISTLRLEFALSSIMCYNSTTYGLLTTAKSAGDHLEHRSRGLIVIKNILFFVAVFALVYYCVSYEYTDMEYRKNRNMVFKKLANNSSSKITVKDLGVYKDG